MESKRSYQELVAWQRAIELVPVVYRILDTFPKHEKYALADQVRRSVVSIAANIAEGQGRQHPKEFVQFLAIARGSLAELHTLLVVANRVNYISSKQLLAAEESLSKVRKPLIGLMKRIAQKA